MNRKISSLPYLLIFVVCSLLLTASAYSASIKERMSTRIPAVNSLKSQGILGENNSGLLEYRSGDKPKQDLITAENKDRNIVYRAIARKQNTTSVLVGKRRAKQIAATGKSGYWFQKNDGSWYKK